MKRAGPRRVGVPGVACGHLAALGRGRGDRLLLELSSSSSS